MTTLNRERGATWFFSAIWWRELVVDVLLGKMSLSFRENRCRRRVLIARAEVGSMDNSIFFKDYLKLSMLDHFDICWDTEKLLDVSTPLLGARYFTPPWLDRVLHILSLSQDYFYDDISLWVNLRKWLHEYSGIKFTLHAQGVPRITEKWGQKWKERWDLYVTEYC